MTSAFASVSAVLTAMKRHGRGALVLAGSALLAAATLSACGGGRAGTPPSTTYGEVTPPAAPPAQSFGYVSKATRQDPRIRFGPRSSASEVQ